MDLLKLGSAIQAANTLRLDGDLTPIQEALVSLGVAAPDSAARLVMMARQYTGDPSATISQFLKSPDFMRMLSGDKAEVSTGIRFCPHCGEMDIL